jgi:hypothetical protein
MFVATMTATDPMSVVLTPAHRAAILEEIEFAFESAGDLTFMLERAPGSQRDQDDARDLISRLHIAVRLLDQLGWERSGDRDGYLLEVDEGVDWFAERIESFARAGLEYNRPGLLAGDERTRATTRRLLDADLAKLRAARVLRTAYKLRRWLSAALEPSAGT